MWPDDGIRWFSWLVASYAMVEWLVRLAMVPVILRRQLQPSLAMAWLAIIFFTPVLGCLVYFLIGRPRLGARRAKRYARLREQVPNRLDQRYKLEAEDDEEVVDQAYLPIVALANQTGGMPILKGNDLSLHHAPDDLVKTLITEIDKAESHVHLLYYIMQRDGTGRRVGEALKRAAQRGVTCRLLVDHGASRGFFKSGSLADELTDAGVRVQPALPVRFPRMFLRRIDVRNHRKLAVIDGRIGFAGSQNLVDPDYGHSRAGPWHDVSGRFTGPIVSALQQVFIEDWACETDEDLTDETYFPRLETTGNVTAQVVSHAPQAEERLVVPQLMVTAITSARRRLLITTPYLVPDEPTQAALVATATRGVEVDIVVPARGDIRLVNAAMRYFFQPLLEAGARIHLHQNGLLHAKTMTVDDAFGLLGSANLDIRSFEINYELNVLLYGSEVVHTLRDVQELYLKDSKQVDPETWRERSVWRRYGYSAAALFSPVL